MGFSEAQVRYLGSLDAVEEVDAERIRYTKEFRTAAAAAYADGASPTWLFRRAGLDPELIGRKRVEKFFEREVAKDPTLMRRRKRAVALAGGADDRARCRYELIEAALSCPLHPTPAERLEVAERCCRALGIDGLPFGRDRKGSR